MLICMRTLLLPKGENDYMDIKDGNPLFTIIVAVLNGKEFLERCIESVTHQTYPHRELIIIDGGSTDGTVEILKNNDDKIAYWKSSPDRGIYHAWNKAFQYARGERICFLGADDYFWSKNVLTDLSPHLVTAEGLGIKVVYGQAARVDKNGRILKLIGAPWWKIRWLMPHGMPLPHPGLMHHHSLFEEHGLFDETFQIAGDYDLLLRELKNGDALYVRDLIVAGWQAGGISDFKALFAHKEAGRARKKNGFHNLSWVWLAVHTRDFFREYWRQFVRK
jgi:glycosyltransferase involved in cell wall biosynthesis